MRRHRGKVLPSSGEYEWLTRVAWLKMNDRYLSLSGFFWTFLSFPHTLIPTHSPHPTHLHFHNGMSFFSISVYIPFTKHGHANSRGKLIGLSLGVTPTGNRARGPTSKKEVLFRSDPVKLTKKSRTHFILGPPNRLLVSPSSPRPSSPWLIASLSSASSPPR